MYAARPPFPHHVQKKCICGIIHVMGPIKNFFAKPYDLSITNYEKVTNSKLEP
jgi:hypothetical protein